MKIEFIDFGYNILCPYGFGFRRAETKKGVVYWLDVGDSLGYAEFTEKEFQKFLKVNKIKLRKMKI